jgi:hypothetical protein
MIPVPAHICDICGEFLPHWCACIVRFSRERYTGRRVVKITDRQKPPE